MDTPPFLYKLIIGDPGLKTMKGTLSFCGITPIHSNYFGSVKSSSDEKRKKWLEDIYSVGLSE